uniref:7TM_GPCR_Srx domain-containing protein n=1 Tax=Panagrellus redivivus TaxID=6233 RepID=A0A7E4ZV60_PANRE
MALTNLKKAKKDRNNMVNYVDSFLIVTDYVAWFTFIIEVVAIVFYTVQFIKKNEIFLSPYFYISTIHLSIHLLTKFSFLIAGQFDEDSFTAQIDDAIQ